MASRYWVATCKDGSTFQLLSLDKAAAWLTAKELDPGTVKVQLEGDW
jgi:hypothetical protein